MCYIATIQVYHVRNLYEILKCVCLSRILCIQSIIASLNQTDAQLKNLPTPNLPGPYKQNNHAKPRRPNFAETQRSAFLPLPSRHG